MRLLHICNDFTYSKVHRDLFMELDKWNISQVIFTYHRCNNYGINQFSSPRVKFIYSKRLVKFYHRLFYQLKLEVFRRELLSKVDVSQFDCINATTLFSDGGLAYSLYKRYHIPYIVAVRSSDINVFMRYLPHTWRMGRAILKSASKIIFISESTKRSFVKFWMVKDIIPDIKNRIIVQPNGINDFWLDNLNIIRNESNNILYVGQFVKRKNVLHLMQAVLKIRQFIPDVHLNLVGGKGKQEKKVLDCVSRYPETFTYHGEIFDRERLRKVYLENAIFAMPSHHETFGLVYLEALSQNLPVVFTKGEGFDGLFDIKVGEAVNSKSVDEIAYALLHILQNRDSYVDNVQINFDRFRWTNIAEHYIKIYASIIERN